MMNLMFAASVPRLLTESECKDLTKMMNFSLRRIEELKPYLQTGSELYSFLTKLSEEYKTKIKDHLLQYQRVLLQHIIFALKKQDKGKLLLNTDFFLNRVLCNSDNLNAQECCVSMFSILLEILLLRW